MIIHLVEVGPRDGLQNEKRLWSVEERVQLINDLSLCGFKEIEVGSFVSAKWIPQMIHTDDVYKRINKKEGVLYSILVPNEKGYKEVRHVHCQAISVFTAASQTFCQKNINCSIEESFKRFLPIMAQAKQEQVRVRGYISCVVGCPYEGDVKPFQVAWVCEKLYEIGCDEISLADTIGVGTPKTMSRMLEEVLKIIPASKLAIHCHDTYNRAFENILIALDYGICVIDSALGGLGGCPYAKGAKGNVSTEEVVLLLQAKGYKIAIDLEALQNAHQTLQKIKSRDARISSYERVLL